MEKTEKIDILLATYNGEEYIKEQIDSILNQTYSNFRLLISDDNSTDKTLEIVREYERKDDRIKVFEHKENNGVIKNFEFLLKQVESDLYMLSDQDDVWYENKIEETYRKLKEDDADLVFTDLEVVDENLNTIYTSMNNYKGLTKKINKTIGSYKLVYLYNVITGCTILSKKKFIKDILPLPNETKYLLHDMWIGLVIALKGKVSYLNKPTIKYRQHGSNEIGTKKVSSEMNSIREIRNHFINVKLELFSEYLKYSDNNNNSNNIFTKEISEENQEALDYYKMLEKKKHCNFRQWGVFNRLYKYESFKYKVENFLILNLPDIANIGFKIKRIFK